MLNILVDYDNIEKTLTSRGVARVIDEILAKIQVADEERVVRLTASFMKVGSCDSARAQREREASVG